MFKNAMFWSWVVPILKVNLPVAAQVCCILCVHNFSCIVWYLSRFAAFLGPFVFPSEQVRLRFLRSGMLSQLSVLMPQLCGLLGSVCVWGAAMCARTHGGCFVSWRRLFEALKCWVRANLLRQSQKWVYSDMELIFVTCDHWNDSVLHLKCCLNTC